MSAMVSFLAAAEFEEPLDGTSEDLPQPVTRMNATEAINAMNLCIVIGFCAVHSTINTENRRQFDRCTTIKANSGKSRHSNWKLKRSTVAFLLNSVLEA